MNTSTSLYPLFSILLVDDEEQFLRTARISLALNGITNVETVTDSRTVIATLSRKPFGVAVLDLNMPNINGKDLLDLIGRLYPEVICIVISGINDLHTAVESMRNGAFDYIVKPVNGETLNNAVRRAIAQRESHLEVEVLSRYILSDTLQHPEAFDKIITCSESMHNVFKYAEAVSCSGMPVLITGETGTGKELLARAIHDASGRTGDFIAVNISGIDDTMLADSLFGHVKGAFTGAEQNRAGLIEKAAQGTIFLDEIGDLSADGQVKLLRLIQEAQYYPIGDDTPHLSTARIIAATNRDLSKEASFRRDLYYRLYTHTVSLPALRKRREDIPLLLRHFVNQAAYRLGKSDVSIPSKLERLMCNYSFPGNVRELEAIVNDTLASHSTGPLSVERLLSRQTSDTPDCNDAHPEFEITFGETLPTIAQAETSLIHETLSRTGGNKKRAAMLLGISRQTLLNKLALYGEV